MLRFKSLHQSGPTKVLCKQSGSGIAEPPAYIPGQTGQGITESPAYIPGQTGGKGSKKAPKPKIVRQKQKPPPKPPKKVKLDPNVNFSSFEWRKNYFGTISSYGGDGYQADIKAKAIELLKYLKEQPEQLMKDQKIDGTVKFSIDELEEALASGNMDDIETAFVNATDELNDPTGSLANKQFIDIKVKKEKVKAAPKTAEQKKADREARKDLPKKELSATQKARMGLKGDARIINQYKNALGEKKWVKNELQRMANGRGGIVSLKKQLETGTTWTGIPLSDEVKANLPAKIAAKQKILDDFVQDWVDNRKPIYLKAKAAYEEIINRKVELKDENLGIPSVRLSGLDKEDIVPELKKIKVKEFGAVAEPPAAPKRKAPPPPSEQQYEDEEEDEGKYAPLDKNLAIIERLEAELERCRAENDELRRRLQIYEEANKAKKEIEKEAKDLISPPPPPSKKKPKKKEEKKKEEEKKPDVKPGEKVVAKSELDKCKEELAKCKEQLAQKGSGKNNIRYLIKNFL